MSRVLGALLALAACGGSPTTTEDGSANGACPYTLDDACIDEDALAQCQAMAAECGDDMAVLESCPLQFACPD